MLPGARILIPTTFAFGALRAGGSGLMLKDCRAHQVIDAVRAVAAGDTVLSPRITRRMLDLLGTQLPSGSEVVVRGSGIGDAGREDATAVLDGSASWAPSPAGPLTPPSPVPFRPVRSATDHLLPGPSG